MKKLALGIVIGLSIVGCSARVKVAAHAKAPEPPKQEQPAPPPPEEPKEGDAIALPQQIEFETGEARIKQTPETLEALEKLAAVMKDHANITKLRIEGHTDDRGTAKRNLKLSRARAGAVAKWLEEHGVDAGRLTTEGFGATKPLVPNDSEAHRAMNRRTEYYVQELDGHAVDPEPQKVASAGTTGGKSAQ